MTAPLLTNEEVDEVCLRLATLCMATNTFTDATEVGQLRALCAQARLANSRQWVPKEPTSEMINVGLEAILTNNVNDSSEQGRVGRIYKAMLAVAPEPPGGETK